MVEQSAKIAQYLGIAPKEAIGGLEDEFEQKGGGDDEDEKELIPMDEEEEDTKEAELSNEDLGETLALSLSLSFSLSLSRVPSTKRARLSSPFRVPLFCFVPLANTKPKQKT